MKILILGSEGQIGAYLMDWLSEEHEVKGFDIVNGDNYDLRKDGNVFLDTHVKWADYVFFLAFDVGGSRYLAKYQDTYDFVNNNTLIMANTFSALKKHNKPFVFASSQMSNMSYSVYGILKAIGEAYTRALNGRVVKFWNVYGIEHDMEKAHVITDFVMKAKTGTLNMLTDGEEYREFLYADDCCEALEMVMENHDNDSLPEELHITSFQLVQIKDIADFIGMYLNAKIVPGTVKDSVQLDKRNSPDPAILNFWRPTTTLFDGILKIIEEMDDTGQ